MDKAGKTYWDGLWTTLPETVQFAPYRVGAAYQRDREFAQLFDRALNGMPNGGLVLEAGAGDSSLLPHFARLGYRIAGVDYSKAGCERLRARLGSQPAEIFCSDIFDPPPTLFASADLVLSCGLVEHFADTTACIRALAGMVRPGGMLLTIVPNMHGLVGRFQRVIAPSVYRVHVPLSPAQLRAAHESAGLSVQSHGHIMATDFGVLNYQEPGSGRAARWVRRMTVAALARASRGATWVDERVHRLPRTNAFSPYCFVIARV